MTSLTSVKNFLSQRTLAIVGLSRSGKKFGNMIYRELTKKGYTVYPIHPDVERIDGVRCYPSLKSLPEHVSGIIIVIPPSQTERVVQDVANAGIKQVWIQQGSESEKAIQLCRENNISVIAGECILMFTEPVAFFHRLHRWIWKVIGKYPK